MLIRPRMTSLKMNVRDDSVVLQVAPSFVSVKGCGVSQPLDRHLPSPNLVADIQNKANFLFQKIKIM